MTEIISMIIEATEPDILLSFSPVLISEGFDERDWRELSRKEKSFILKIVFKELGFDSESDPVPLKSYSATSTVAISPNDQPSLQGHLEVDVFETNRSDEGLYLHKINNLDPNSVDEWFLTSKDYEVSF